MNEDYNSIKAEWEREYILYNPEPIKIETTNNYDWWNRNSKMLITFIVALALVIGSRTGRAIYGVNKDEGFTPLIAMFLSAALVWGVEGYIAYYGITRPRSLNASRFEKSLGMLAMIVGAMLSAVAGLNYVLDIANTLKASIGDGVETVLSLLLSIGLTFVLYGISEFAGRARWEHENMPQIEEQAYRQKLRDYKKAMGEAWQTSPEYIELRGERLRRAEELKIDIASAGVGRSKLRRERQKLELEVERQRMLNEKFGESLVANKLTKPTKLMGDGEARQEIIQAMIDWENEYNEKPRQVDIIKKTGRNKSYIHDLWHERYDTQTND